MQKGQELESGFEMSSLPEALGVSEAFFEFQQRLSEVAKIDRPVLIIGERGTGKELAASRLHYLSQRWQGPLVALNCAALAESVLESELFGHEVGAFTGATSRRVGRFEAAEGGTLFLDEIGLVSMTVQEKILRAVEYGVFQRVGGSTAIKVNVRIVGATNADLPAMAEQGKFKRDLLDRLSFDVLYLPPLRFRSEDIEYLAQHFAGAMVHELGLPGVVEFSEKAIRSINGHDWPGNIRELKNVIERSVYRTGSARIDRIELDPFTNPYEDRTVVSQGEIEGEVQAASLPEQLKALELSCLKKALLDSGYKQQAAAEKLGLSYHQFRSLYRKYKDMIT